MKEIKKPKNVTYFIAKPANHYGIVSKTQTMTSGQDELEEFTNKAIWIARLNELEIEHNEK